MAKKNSRHYPVVRHIRIDDTSPLSGSNAVLDIGQYLSKINRRLYRQGRYYEVKVDIDPAQTGNIEVFALRDDWAVQKAYQMAFQAFLDNNMDEREQLGKNQIARWEDFRVDPGVGVDFTPKPVFWNKNLTAELLTAGEFELSTVTDTSQLSRTFTWESSPTGTVYSIMDEYNLAANANQSPSTSTADGPYANIRNELDVNQLTDLQEHGDLPPYNQTSINAVSPWVKIATLGVNSGVQKLSTGFFTAPCGFVVIRAVTAADLPRISCVVKSGDYKGVHAPAMLEMSTVNRKRKVVK